MKLPRTTIDTGGREEPFFRKHCGKWTYDKLNHERKIMYKLTKQGKKDAKGLAIIVGVSLSIIAGAAFLGNNLRDNAPEAVNSTPPVTETIDITAPAPGLQDLC